ncbi:hypothetical protein CCICO_08000 [Corynebacterium ciconiae DSM 44920]|nr:hypothetical protein CCICO_08000 [Corynebacterium ciconiae DSM 44920]
MLLAEIQRRMSMRSEMRGQRRQAAPSEIPRTEEYGAQPDYGLAARRVNPNDTSTFTEH